MPANPNTVTAGIPALWAKALQLMHYKQDVYRDIASFSEEGLLTVGDTVHRVYQSNVIAYDTGLDGSFTRQVITQGDETLVVNKDKNVATYVKDLDRIQNMYDFVARHSENAGHALSNVIDREVLAAACEGAGSVIDNSFFGGTAGDGITLTTSNIVRVFTAADERLNYKNVADDNRFGVISTKFRQILLELNAGRETPLGDDVSLRGRVPGYFNFSLNRSNQVEWTGELLMGTTPTDADTVTINGVVFTFETSTIDAAGKVKAETSGAVSAGYLVAAINAPFTTSATYQTIADTEANRLAMDGVTAAVISGGIKITAKGKSYIVVSETLSAPSDVWTPARQIQHNLFGRRGNISVVVQKSPSTEVRIRDGYIGKDILAWEAFGYKVFADQAPELVDVKIATNAF